MRTILVVFISYFFSGPIYGNFFEPNFKAKYIQQYKSDLKGKMIKTEGIIEYSYPSRIRFEQQAPDQLLYISNPRQSWLYTPPIFDDMDGDLIEDPTGKNYPYAKLFDVLKAGLKDNKYYKVSLIDKVKRLYQFSYSEEMRKKLGLMKTVVKFGSKPSLKNIVLLELTYIDGKTVKLTFDKIETDVKFPKDYFFFTMPITSKKR